MPNPVIEHIHLSGVTYDVKDIGAERLDNKVSTFQDAPDDAHYPSEKLVHDKLVELSSDISQLLDEKQDRLISGDNIKTINNQSLLGSGNIEVSGGGMITVDDALSDTSENPVQNKVIKAALDTKGTYSKPENGIPTSDLARFSVETDKIANESVTAEKLSSDVNQVINGKQERLVSGNNIKNVNGNSILGSGNIIVSGGTFTLSSPEILQYIPVTVKIAAD